MRFRLARPTVNSYFHVDWDWFRRNKLGIKSLVHNQLCPQCLREFSEGVEVQDVDYIDPETGEVFKINNLWEAILAHCQWQPNYLDNNMPLNQRILRVFLASNNEPMTVKALARELGLYDPNFLLRVLMASGVQNGVVPVRE